MGYGKKECGEDTGRKGDEDTKKFESVVEVNLGNNEDSEEETMEQEAIDDREREAGKTDVKGKVSDEEQILRRIKEEMEERIEKLGLPERTPKGKENDTDFERKKAA